MYKQNEPGLDTEIQKVGCYFLSLCAMIERETGVTFTIDMLNTLWMRLKQIKIIDESLKIINPDIVLKEALASTNKKKPTILQVGQAYRTEEITFWSWVEKAPRYKDYKYIVEMVRTQGTEGTHFILRDKDKNLLFDSYDFKKYTSERIPRFIYYMVIS